MKLWIARDSYGLWLFNNKPKKVIINGDKCCKTIIGNRYKFDDELFQEVTFENSPQQVEIKLIKEEQIMEIKKSDIVKMANDYVNDKNHEHYPDVEKSYLFEGYVEGIMEFCQKMNINVIV